MLLFLFITLAIGLILFYDGYKKDGHERGHRITYKEYLKGKVKDGDTVCLTDEEYKDYWKKHHIKMTAEEYEKHKKSSDGFFSDVEGYEIYI